MAFRKVETDDDNERATLDDVLDAVTALREAFDAERELRLELLTYIRSQTGKADDNAEALIRAITKTDPASDIFFDTSELFQLAEHDHELAEAIGKRSAKDLGALLKKCRGKAIAGRVLHRDGRGWVLSFPASLHHCISDAGEFSQ